MTLSVAIITHNEAANLPRTLASILWADQVVVVDAHSTDATVSIAQAAGAQVFLRDWQGFALQKNFAISQCTGDWVLSLDADEEVSETLAKEIQTVLSAKATADAYSFPRRTYFLGRALFHGGYYPDAKLRLFRRGAATFEDRRVHESIQCQGTTGHLHGDLLHYAYPSLATYIEHMNRYSTLSAEILIEKRRVSLGLAAFVWNTLLTPTATFLYNYIFRLGFLDGREGLLFHLYHSTYVSWKYAKAWDLSRNKG
ncbi:MAG TPA: glycosyltransferase family 2 protein [Acidobacteriaceae bacterium]|jgi:glycosyltransferase involved in cell wall biosynthesis|nr:glycosyltransferase family 2 protein [Acidobacteriaceae bacterium]